MATHRACANPQHKPREIKTFSMVAALTRNRAATPQVLEAAWH